MDDDRAFCNACQDATAVPGQPLCARCDDNLSHLYALVYDQAGLGFCGCGCPDEAYALVRGTLGLMPLYENDGSARALALAGTTGAYHLVLYALDRAGLTEHGGSVGGSWLTPRGRHYLGLMRQYKADDLDESGYPHDGRGCPADCPHAVACAV